MPTRSNEEAEQHEQHKEKGSDLILKGASLLTLAGLILFKSMEGGLYLNDEPSILLKFVGISLCVAGFISAYLVFIAGSFTFFSGVQAYERIFRIQDRSDLWKKIYNFLLACVFGMLIVGLVIIELN